MNEGHIEVTFVNYCMCLVYIEVIMSVTQLSLYFYKMLTARGFIGVLYLCCEGQYPVIGLHNNVFMEG